METKIIGIVCEYDPFHLGHLYQLRESRERLGDAAVVCVMSGDFVQRGAPASFTKSARAEAACRGGADLVVELPVQWSLASAEGFARGAVGILSRLGCTHISFGSEAGDLEGLKLAAEHLSSREAVEDIRRLMKLSPQLSFPRARSIYLDGRCPGLGALAERPNNLLGIEYLKAMIELGSPMEPMTIARRGHDHDSPGLEGYPSASQLRALMGEGRDISPWIPEGAMEVYRREMDLGRIPDRDRWELALMSRLRMLHEDSYLSLPDAGDGTGARLYRAVRENESLDQILESAKNKRVALARLRRMVCCAALGIQDGESKALPPYARVLAIGERGRALLRLMEDISQIPLVIKPASVRKLGDEAGKVYAVGANAHDLYSLLFAASGQRKPGSDWRTGPKIV